MKSVLLTLSFLLATASTFAATTPAAATAPAAVSEDAASTSPTTAYTKAIFAYHPATGTVLVNENGDMLAGPASLTKLMTLYLTFEALKEKRIALDTQVPVSEKAWRTEGSKMFIKVGEPVPVEMLIKGIAIVSGNDACVAIAEHLGGTEDGFVAMMNKKAADLGMTHTHFMDSNGLPAPEQKSTAHDIAMLLTAIFRDFPEYQKFLAEEDFTWNGIHQQNRNGLLHTDLGIDAGKTGHTEDSGYHLASTAVQNGERLVVVVMGTNSFSEREGESMRVYRTLFASHVTAVVYKPGDVLAADVPVWQGTQSKVSLTVKEPVSLYINRSNPGNIKASITYNKPLVAPLAADTPVGELHITTESGQTVTAALVPATPVAKAGFMGRFFQTLGHKFGM
jgi:D-alanyl-D-alanine carboxypeptidase (penicillin-binding protein 5/6)